MSDARDWLAANVTAAANVLPATWEIVEGFALLWFLFEERLCGTDANRHVFAGLAQQFGNAQLTGTMQAAYGFWEQRYCANGVTNSSFDELFAEPSGKAKTAAILLDLNPTSEQRFFALLMIVYRLRNNLFHGAKEIGKLNGQRENLEMGSRTLEAVMEHFAVH